MPDLVRVFDRFRDVPIVSISNAQRDPMPWANWQETIYHGLPEDVFRFYPDRGDYLAFLGRISPEKGADRAIEIAKRVDMPLKIAAKVDRADRRYFKRVVEPLLNDPHVEWVGEISDQEKNEFLGNAYALLFPIDWPEPFGLVNDRGNGLRHSGHRLRAGICSRGNGKRSNRLHRKRAGRRGGSSSPGSQSQSRLLPRSF